jgi:hypothetical protein
VGPAEALGGLAQQNIPIPEVVVYSTGRSMGSDVLDASEDVIRSNWAIAPTILLCEK